MKFYPNYPSTQGPCLRVYIHNLGREWIPITDILSLEGEKGYSWLNYTNGRRVSLPYSLKYIQDLLPATHFLRVHRRYLLNRQYIERIDREENGHYIYMKIGHKIPVSRRRLTFIEKEISDHCKCINFMCEEEFTEANTRRLSELLKVLAHPIRLKIVNSLSQHRELNVSTIEKQVSISQSSVSHHLIKMNDKGILTSVRRSKEIYYSLTDPTLADWLTLMLKMGL